MAMSQEDLQNEIAKAQQIQQQLENVISQKQQLESKKNDLERALEEINELEKETPMYKNVGGNILIQVEDREELIDELEDDLESSEVRIKTLSKQEEKLRDTFQKLQEELSSKMGGIQQGPVSGGS